MAKIELTEKDFVRTEEIWNPEYGSVDVDVYVFGQYVGTMHSREEAEEKFRSAVLKFWNAP